jgi:hypothetical protein
MAYIARSNSGKNIFAVGEYWAPGYLHLLQKYIEVTEGCMSLFDSSLQNNFHNASKEGILMISEGFLMKLLPRQILYIQ